MSGKENAEHESNHPAKQQREAMRRRDEKGLLPKALRKLLVTFNRHYAVNWWGQKPDSSELMMGDKKNGGNIYKSFNRELCQKKEKH